MVYRMLPSSSLFTSEPIPGGASWTLTTYFGKMLSEAEELYGRRDMDWTPIGVEFFAGDVPRICVFPGGRKHVLIRLTLAALNDLDEALWQLAHETVHVLGPVEGNTNNLEEGVATHFALSVPPYDTSRVTLFRQSVEQTASPYRSPLRDYEALLQIDSGVIKKLRKQQPYLSLVTAKQILDVLPSCDPTLAVRLVDRFSATSAASDQL
jgi:hypothetical protein